MCLNLASAFCFCYILIMSHQKAQTYFFIFCLVATSVVTLGLFWPYLTLIALGGVLAVISAPLYKLIVKGLKSEGLAAFLTVFIAFLILVVPLFYFLTFFSIELVEILPKLKNILDKTVVINILRDRLPDSANAQIPAITDSIFNFVRTGIQEFSKNIFGFFSDIVRVLFGFFVVLISAYYFLKDGQKLRNEILAISPLGDEYNHLIINRIVIAVRAVMGGVLIIGILKGIIASIFFALFGIPAPLFWGVMTGVASFVPIIGSSLVTVPAFAYLAYQGRYGTAFLFLAVAVGIIGSVDNFLQPKIVQSKIDIHPLLILLSIIGGLQFYGFSGFIIGPLTLAVTMALIDIYKKNFHHKVSPEN